MKFRVLRGTHSEGGRIYKKGDVVDSKSDLNKFNIPGNANKKFLELEDDAKSSKGTSTNHTVRKKEETEEESIFTLEELNSLPLKEIKNIAEEYGIDNSSLSNKKEYIDSILKASN